MSRNLWKQAAEIFAQVVDLPSDEVDSFLDSKCGNDAELRAEIASMIAEDAEATQQGFLTPVVETPVSNLSDLCQGDEKETVQRSIGSAIGQYRIERLINQGGMGTVYLAARTTDFESKVAIKLIRRGMDSDTVVARFQNEIQLQATLGQHPNIAGIVDAGRTREGLPYFVMEFVDGVRIDEYCDHHQLTTRERLQLFVEVCSAVQFAHQSTVIHRDLKPSNILVNEDGRPILIDFGIAKVLQDEYDPAAELTATGGVFTPGYASPEQVQSMPLSTATDVYSLGVVLYELLVGRKPYRIKSESIPEIIEAIVSQAPTQPSRAVAETDSSENTKAAPKNNNIHERRSATVRQLQQQLAGEIDDIVLMALRKDPVRRYSTVNALESDIRNYLDGHPVSARPDSFAYRTTKFIQRNKLPVAIAAMLAVSLVAGIIGTSMGLIRANREWKRAEENASKAVEQEQIAQTQKEHAEEQERLAKASELDARKTVRDFYLRVSNEQLFEAPSLQPLRLEFLESALDYYQKANKRRPNDLGIAHSYGNASFHVATARMALGKIPEANEAMLQAQELLERSSQSTNDDLAQSSNSILGRVYMLRASMVAQMRKLDEALSWYEKSEEKLTTAVNIFPEDVALKFNLSELYSALGFHWGMQGSHEKAQKYLGQAMALRLEVCDLEPDVDSHKYHLARSYWDVGYEIREAAIRQRDSEDREAGLDEAMQYYDKSVAILGPLVDANRDSFAYQMVLGEVYASIGFVYFYANKAHDLTAEQKADNSRLALEAYKDSLLIRKRLVEQNPGVQRMIQSLAKGYSQVGMEQRILKDYDAALGSHRNAVEMWRELIVQSPNDIRIIQGLASALSSLGLTYLDKKEPEQAETIFREATATQKIAVERAPGYRRYQVAYANQLLNLSLALRDQREFERAAAKIKEAIKASPRSPDQVFTIAQIQTALAARVSNNDSASGEKLDPAPFVDESIRIIQEGLESGRLNKNSLAHPDFDILRDDSRFAELISAE